jgi:hypothetical protein
VACLRQALGGRSGRPLIHSSYTTTADAATGVAIPAKLERKIVGDLEAAGLPVFKQHLHELQAYKAIFEPALRFG